MKINYLRVIYLGILIIFCNNFLLIASCYQFGFLENRGQIVDQFAKPNSEVLYMSQQNELSVQLKSNSFSYELTKQIQESITSKKTIIKTTSDSVIIKRNRIDIEFVGANPHPLIVPEEEIGTYYNYYTVGTTESGVTNIRSFKKITYKNMYSGIDFVFFVNSGNKIKYDIVLHPGANINDIKIKYKGIEEIVNTNNNELILVTSLGNIIEKIPISFEIENSKKVNVVFKEIENKNVWGFECESRNINNTLIIDPWVTYFGGNNVEENLDIATDATNNIITVGPTQSTTNIATSGAYQTIFGGARDGYIAKFSANGALQWCTFYGGAGDDYLTGCAVDGSNNIFIAGTTSSTNNIATSGSFQPNISANLNAFIAKFDSTGLRKWGTYFGGDNGSYCRDICVDYLNNVIVTGFTSSNINIASLSAFQPNIGGGDDAFLAKFSSSGSRLWATYYGGSNPDDGFSIITDKSGNVILTGRTNSANNIITSGAHQSSLGGIFISKFNSQGIRIWGTYYGEPNSTDAYSIKTDKYNNIIVSGLTGSLTEIATAGAYQTSLAGQNDCFLVKFDSMGVRLWGTYFGGSNIEIAHSITIDSSDNIFISGSTESANGIATNGAFQTNLYGMGDAFVAKFFPSGAIDWSTYFGGGNDDGASGIVIGKNNSVIITGTTMSDSNIATTGAYQTIYGGNQDAFIACFDSSGHITSIPSFPNESISCIIKLLPNPTKELLTVTMENIGVVKGNLSIIDAFGKIIKSIDVKEKEIIIDVRNFSSGVYLLRYEADGIVETAKFVKE